MKKVPVPYKPRYPQGEIHKELETHRFSVLVAHRRMGKTVLAINHLIKRSLTDNKERGFYAYIAPYRNQAEQIAWSYLKHYTSPFPLTKINEQKLSITMPNGATLRLFGADNPDALRGAYFDGVIIDEVAQIKPEVWGEIIRPALADRNGWAVFIGTPKGVNLFSQLYDKAISLVKRGDKDWCAMLYDINQTGAIKAEEVEKLKDEMSENEFRQEFLCDFNAAADNALISIEVAREASRRVYREDQYIRSPRIIGVDVARFGSDSSVIFKRQGLVAFEPIIINKMDNMAVADRVAMEIAHYKPDAVFIDIGNGSGVVDRLRQLGHEVTEIAFGGKATRDDLFQNRRIEMWWNMKEWLEAGGAIPSSVVLQGDLCAPFYGYSSRGVKILESKDKMKERIGRSPDLADALALTFALPVAPRLTPYEEKNLYGSSGVSSYDPDKAFEAIWR